MQLKVYSNDDKVRHYQNSKCHDPQAWVLVLGQRRGGVKTMYNFVDVHQYTAH